MQCFVRQSLNPNVSVIAIFAAQHQASNIVEEQFRKYKLTELVLSAIHLKD